MESIELMKNNSSDIKISHHIFFLHIARLEGTSVFPQDGQMMSKKKELYAS